MDAGSRTRRVNGNRPQVYAVGFSSPGTMTHVSVDGGRQPDRRQNSRELFHLAPDRTMYASVGMDGADLRLGAPAALVKVHTGSSLSQFDDGVTAYGNRFIVNVDERPPIDAFLVVRHWAVEHR